MTHLLDVDSLLELPGIGEKISGKLIEHFGSEESALEVLRKHDVASLSSVPGISEKYAISLIHEVIAGEEGVSIEEFLRTQEAYSVYEKIIGLIRSYAHTPYSRAKISTFIPYPSKRADRIKAIQAEIEDYVTLANTLKDDAELNAALKKVRHLKEPSKAVKSRDRAIFTDSKEDYEKLVRDGVDRYLDVYFIESMGELVDIAKGYSQPLVLGSRFAATDFPDDMGFEFMEGGAAETWWLAPEAVIAFFAANKEPIEASLRAIKIIRERSGHVICSQLDDAKISELSQEMARITPEGELEMGVDPEVDRLKGVLDRHGEAFKAALKKANADLHERMENNTVTLKGSQLLGMFGEKGEAGLKSMLEKEVARAYSAVINEAKESIKAQLALKPFEMQYVDMMFSDDIVYPIELNYRAVDSFKSAINRQLSKRSLDLKRGCAKRLSKLKTACMEMVREVLEFDTYFAIGSFAADYGLNMPAISDKAGISISSAYNIFLRGRAKKVEPVSYAVGIKTKDTKGERVVILSGVNSGGKTTMLDLLAQVVILSHMGFPVPAESAEVGLVDELMYFSKSKGTLTAGAFEATIKSFSSVIGKSRKVVLVDELESITEPGASAKIIAGILETLHENENSIAVFVSHLAEQILENTKCGIRVDGIEAKGLDANLNLIVDRSPRYNYLARSTPELIVERLTRASDGDEKLFYQKLLGKFKGL
ncbi:DNA mismatch repair protein, MutS family [Methanocella conradii HZ254]|uniref:DNA-binding protein MutS2 n=1 Tax=Methanocella conradii (strain DSM 24694 / JCM 17849 / CGMCC 1.5162 / HZ254) TaxID=1041930 RepID=H8I7P6_METCZ|nr:helix-hairpin-helix domain-containing protein [Methanocella conradii]AFC99881.1 DNA mismatch repair protein, MutS family [Methanocella conradii HZ254]